MPGFDLRNHGLQLFGVILTVDRYREADLIQHTFKSRHDFPGYLIMGANNGKRPAESVTVSKAMAVTPRSINALA